MRAVLPQHSPDRSLRLEHLARLRHVSAQRTLARNSRCVATLIAVGYILPLLRGLFYSLLMGPALLLPCSWGILQQMPCSMLRMRWCIRQPSGKVHGLPSTLCHRPSLSNPCLTKKGPHRLPRAHRTLAHDRGIVSRFLLLSALRVTAHLSREPRPVSRELQPANSVACLGHPQPPP